MKTGKHMGVGEWGGAGVIKAIGCYAFAGFHTKSASGLKVVGGKVITLP